MSSPFQRRIFISYRTADELAKVVISTLRQQLEGMYGPESVFWDRLSLHAGRWDEQLEGNVTNSDAVIVLIGDTEAWKGCVNGRVRIEEDDDWVRREVALALDLASQGNGKLIVPLVLSERASVPKAEDLPADLGTLSRWQKQTLGSIENLLVERVNGFCTWLAKELPLPQDRRALVNRLSAPLQTIKAKRELSRTASLEKWIPLFWAAAGILPPEERRALRGCDRAAMLTHLASIKKNLPMLQFLALAIEHLDLPEAIEEAWDAIIDDACQSPQENGWYLDELNSEDLFNSVRSVEVAPRLQVHFEERLSDAGAYPELVASGSLSLGWDQKQLALPNSSVPWEPDFTPHEKEAWLAELLRRLHEYLIDMLGEIAEDPANMPRLELFLDPSQLDWKFDRLPITNECCAGQVFRITRRLYLRHYGPIDAMSKQAWEIKSKRYQQNGEQALATCIKPLNQWIDLDAADGDHLCFVIPSFWEESAHDNLLSQGMVSGLWVQSPDCHLGSLELEGALNETRWIHDVIAAKRLTGRDWDHAALLVDPFEAPPPYNSRCTDEENLDEVFV